jgi:hypothetical protein
MTIGVMGSSAQRAEPVWEDQGPCPGGHGRFAPAL